MYAPTSGFGAPSCLPVEPRRMPRRRRRSSPGDGLVLHRRPGPVRVKPAAAGAISQEAPRSPAPRSRIPVSSPDFAGQGDRLSCSLRSFRAAEMRAVSPHGVPGVPTHTPRPFDKPIPASRGCMNAEGGIDNLSCNGVLSHSKSSLISRKTQRTRETSGPLRFRSVDSPAAGPMILLSRLPVFIYHCFDSIVPGYLPLLTSLGHVHFLRDVHSHYPTTLRVLAQRALEYRLNIGWVDGDARSAKFSSHSPPFRW